MRTHRTFCVITGGTTVSGTIYPSGTYEFTIGFSGVCVAKKASVFCLVFVDHS